LSYEKRVTVASIPWGKGMECTRALEIQWKFCTTQHHMSFGGDEYEWMTSIVLGPLSSPLLPSMSVRSIRFYVLIYVEYRSCGVQRGRGVDCGKAQGIQPGDIQRPIS